MERRLAAILAADLVDYSRLMGEDESRTLAALQQLRAEIFGPSVAGHGGKLVKSMGDGWLVEFPSIGAAVDCGVAIQQELDDGERMKENRNCVISWNNNGNRPIEASKTANDVERR